MLKIGQILFPGNKYRLLAPEAAEELDHDGGTVRLTELELLEFVGHGRGRGIGVFLRESGELVEIPSHAFDPRPATTKSKLSIAPLQESSVSMTKKQRKPRKKIDKIPVKE